MLKSGLNNRARYSHKAVDSRNLDRGTGVENTEFGKNSVQCSPWREINIDDGFHAGPHQCQCRGAQINRKKPRRLCVLQDIKRPIRGDRCGTHEYQGHALIVEVSNLGCGPVGGVDDVESVRDSVEFTVQPVSHRWEEIKSSDGRNCPGRS